MRQLLMFIPVLGLCILCGCAAVASRTVGYRKGGVGGPPFFSGVSLDCIQVGDRDSIEPGLRYNPAIAVIDTPFSLVGDILLLPYDTFQFAAHPAH